MIYVGKDQFRTIADVPESVPSATISATPFKTENFGAFGVADNDFKGERGGTMHYVVAKVPKRLRPEGIEINFLTKLYFRTWDKREDVHPAAVWAYDIVQSNLVRN